MSYDEWLVGSYYWHQQLQCGAPKCYNLLCKPNEDYSYLRIINHSHTYYLVGGLFLICCVVSHILGTIIPFDELIFFGGVGIPPTIFSIFHVMGCHPLTTDFHSIIFQDGYYL